eukprot:TRINITY_DN3034_c0_g1_i1.p1 TRINITY_DN3034_c0_g1~~TRINITY_DN3034_c0_g1_i1.p1  ORF type:complete len:478 (-),score=51.41 TRINITY_DN3034_c0_g1_i1:11-1444(-)
MLRLPRAIVMEDGINLIGFGKFQYVLFFIAGLSWLTDAMEILLLSYLTLVVGCEWNLSISKQALVVTAVFIGMLIGAPIWGIISDKYGRRLGYLLATGVTLVFSVASAFSPDYFFLIITRGLVGVGLGGSHIPFALLAEFLPTKQRAYVLGLVQFFWALGSGLEAVLALTVFSLYNDKDNWRLLVGLTAIPALISLLCYPAVPESFRFYMNSGREDKAHELLSKAAVWNKAPAPTTPIVSILEDNRGRIVELFKSNFLRLTLLVCVCWFISSFVYYGMVLLPRERSQDVSHQINCHHLNLSSPTRSAICYRVSKQEAIEVLITAGSEVPGVILTIVFIELLGRRGALAMEYLIGAVITGLLMLCLSNSIELLFLSAVRAIFTGTFQALCVYTPEAYPTHIRATAFGVAISSSRLGGVLSPFVVDFVMTKTTIGGLGVYGLVAFLGVILSAFLPYSHSKMKETLSISEKKVLLEETLI